MARYVVAEAGEIPPGGRKIVEIEGRSVGIFHINGEYFALLNWCPHQGAALCEGQLWSALEGAVPGDYRTSRQGEIIACIYHGWEFDVRTGQSWCDPQRLRVRAYDVHVEPGSAIASDGIPTPAATAVQERGDPEAPAAGMVKGPYMAQTYPVSLDGQYVVVDLGRTASRPATDGAQPSLRSRHD